MRLRAELSSPELTPITGAEFEPSSAWAGSIMLLSRAVINQVCEANGRVIQSRPFS